MRAFEYSFPVEVKRLAASSGELSGYASTFGNADLGGDVVQPGAFAASLAEHKADDTMPSMLWSHDPSEPIGIWTDVAEDAKGLLVKGKLTLDAKRGAEARALAKDGALALSIGFQTRDADFENGRRVLRDVKLFEVSLVSMPMNPKARLIDVKSMPAGEIRDAVAFKKFLKAHGFPDALAKRLASHWNACVRRDTLDAEAVATAIRDSATKFTTPTENGWGGCKPSLNWRD